MKFSFKPLNDKVYFKNSMRMWLNVVFFVIILVYVVLVGVVAFIVQNKGSEYTEKALEQGLVSSSSDLDYKRGTIVDTNGTVLAESKTYYTLVLEPKQMYITYRGKVEEDGTDNRSYPYVENTVKVVAKITGKTEAEILKLIEDNKDSSYLVLQEPVFNEETGEPVMVTTTSGKVQKKEAVRFEYKSKAEFESYKLSPDKEINGVKIDHRYVGCARFEEHYERVYPNGSLASNVLGYVQKDGQGAWGIEESYQKYLEGKNGYEYSYYDSELNAQKITTDAVDGDTVTSTINASIQKIVEEKILEFDKTWDYDNVAVVMMDPNSGEIIAMASNEGFDLNNPQDLSYYYSPEELAEMTDTEQTNALYKMWRNYCVSSTYEPGSTWKLVTVASALEENVINEKSTFNCEKYVNVAGTVISCSGTHGKQDVAGAIAHSCNPALIQISSLLGGEKFYAYQEHFGFGRKTGIDLPGEAKGILMDAELITHPVELATSSFGQSFNVTMVQMASAFSSLVNGGYYYQPHIVKKVTDSKGITVKENKPVVVNRTISETTSEFIRRAILQTVEAGTARSAKIEGYSVGGKTGTAKRGVRSDLIYVLSFIGCVPVDDPQVVCYVVVDNVHDEEKKASSSLAQGLFADILKEALPELGVYPEGEIDYRIDETIIEDNGIDESGDELVLDADGDGIIDGTNLPLTSENIAVYLDKSIEEAQNIIDGSNGEEDDEDSSSEENTDSDEEILESDEN